MKIIVVGNIDKFLKLVITNPSKKSKKITKSIILDVKKNGDSAVLKYEKKFGGIIRGTLKVSKREISNAYSQVNKDQISAIKIAKKRLTKTELTIKNKLKDFVIKTDGIILKKLFIPLSSVGCYVPGGSARYPSSLIMSAVPAKIAGVKRIVVVTPPNKNGNVDPLTLVTADICGIDEIYKIGGAQAIAALSYGTDSIIPVDKIVGPGNIFVSTAKSLVSEDVGIDMVAGPTELGIIADSSANPELISSDLISQAEHSIDTFCFVLTTSENVAKKIIDSLNQKIKNIKRKDIVKKSLEQNGFIAICDSENKIIQLANKLAPEHLEIITKNPKSLASKITAAGLVLLGENTPSSASDYLLGSNHILPTNGFGKIRGSLSVLDFIKLGTEVESSKQALQKISKYMNVLCDSEGLPNHYEAVRSRLK
ncbi:MAG TPA: histidinol dehydrogenase [Nitrosopumilaceae archaeon]|nr:histidinol dehydrogenase [Nitrosopumilaceae archaeon]